MALENSGYGKFYPVEKVGLGDESLQSFDIPENSEEKSENFQKFLSPEEADRILFKALPGEESLSALQKYTRGSIRDSSAVNTALSPAVGDVVSPVSAGDKKSENFENFSGQKNVCDRLGF